MDRKTTIDVSAEIIIKTVLVLLGVWLLYLIRDIIALLFISVILTAAIGPIVSRLQKRKIPRPMGVLIIYLILFIVIGLLFSFIIPPLLAQFKSLVQNFPSYAEKFTALFQGLESYFGSYGVSFNSQDFVKNITTGFIQSSGEVFSTTVSVFSGLISVIVVLSITFYMSVKENSIKKFLVSVTPRRHHEYVSSAVDRIEVKIGKWLQGQIIVMFFIFVLSFFVLYFLKVPYALLLALIGGLFEIIPYIGPIVSGALATIVGFLVSPFTGFLVLLAYIIIHQVESQILVPQIMKKTVGLNPVAVILALLVGAKLGGILGAILSIPIAAMIGVFVNDVIVWGKQSPTERQEQLEL